LAFHDSVKQLTEGKLEALALTVKLIAAMQRDLTLDVQGLRATNDAGKGADGLARIAEIHRTP